MKKRQKLGLMVDSTDSDYSKEIIDGVMEFCQKNGLDLLVFSGHSFGWPYDWGYQSTAVFNHIHQENIDALVITTGTQCNFIGEEAFAAWVKKLHPLPVISISVPLEGIPSVVTNNVTGLKNLLEHLYNKHNARSFGVLTGPEENIEARQRLNVFYEFLKDNNLKKDKQVYFNGDFSAESCYKTLDPWLEKNPINFDALICMNDTMASAALKILKDKGYSVPKDLMLTGFDDALRSRYESPTLSTITQDLKEQGRVAAQLAYNLIQNKPVDLITTLETKSLYRQSCGCITSSEMSHQIVAIDDDETSIELETKILHDATSRWFRLQDDVLNFRGYLSQMTSLISLGDLTDRLPWGLELFNIDFCALVLFNKTIVYERDGAFSLPNKAELVFWYDTHRPEMKNTKATVFDPRSKILPFEAFDSENRSLVTFSLNHRDTQLGYLVWSISPSDPAIFETICVQLSSTIRSALLFEAKQEIETRLHSALKDLERYNTKLSAISQTDELTGLYNRRGFISLGQESMDLALRMEKQGLVVFADMDGLKIINDTYGHEAGDKAIIAMAEALKNTFRSIDIVSRLGGDEFAIVAVDISAEFIKTLRCRLDTILENYNASSGEPYLLSISLGVVAFTGSENNQLKDLLSLADSVLYEEKKIKHAQAGLIKNKKEK